MACGATSHRDNNPATDTVLEVGQRLFNVNRVMLASASEYFRALFGGGARESSENHIVLRGLDPEAFQLLLGFAARGRVSVDRQNVEALLEAADFLLFDRVKLLCAAFLQRELRVGNCAGALALAQRLACPGLAAAARGVALTHLAAFMAEEEEFLQLPKEAPAELLASDHLYVTKEDQVFEAVMKWVSHHDSREGQLLELLALVRAPFLSLAFLDLLIKRSKRRLEDDPHSRLLRILNHNLPQSWTKTQSQPQSSRSYETMYVLGGKHDQEQQELFQFHPKTNTWQACSPLRRRNLTQYAVAAVGNFIFVTGGYFRDEVVWYCVDWVLIYNYCEDSWMEGPAMKQSRNWHCAVGVGMYLYVLGGSTDAAVIADVERLPLMATDWEDMEPMVEPVERAAVVSAGTNIYVLCGLDEKGDVYSGVQRLDVDNDVWDVISFSPLPRYDLCATILNGAIYVVGGQTFRLDTDTDEWTPVDEECLNQKFFSGCTTVNGRIFLLAERRGNTSIPNMVLFDPYTDTCQVVDVAVPCPLPIRSCVSIQKFNVRSGV
ncbi:kelch-like protein 23 [Carcharodon carcharias]|uniref:kelch-like protein 23 n=1 Tax=Carcharodon carcharias TaxID=13397 RepID=UPI001B7DF4EA|nr:kelch-like protein 23 [Carcharodon carcharias]